METPKENPTLEQVMENHPYWTEAYLLGMRVRDFEALAPCPFCNISYRGFTQAPSKSECKPCFGRGKVPSSIVEDLKSTTDYETIQHLASVGDIRD